MLLPHSRVAGGVAAAVMACSLPKEKVKKAAPAEKEGFNSLSVADDWRDGVSKVLIGEIVVDDGEVPAKSGDRYGDVDEALDYDEDELENSELC
ncbi:hypothetical protein NDU88_000375 [Pleurodeles waltl]|uniref:Uncharacterized protein n=1 Tax=Pleurodeles waltl TaxID=8319 RepID=A0AAV7TET6_PLEWA|nr:hypothetical protein NDU88_000375 [Pleurodeles waltl]